MELNQSQLQLLFDLLMVRGVKDRAFLCYILGLEEFDGILGYQPYNKELIIKRNCTSACLPDFCINCLQSFGETIGGRVRQGCCNCNTAMLRPGQTKYNRYVEWIQFTNDPTDYLLCLCYKRGKYG